MICMHHYLYMDDTFHLYHNIFQIDISIYHILVTPLYIHTSTDTRGNVDKSLEII